MHDDEKDPEVELEQQIDEQETTPEEEKVEVDYAEEARKNAAEAAKWKAIAHRNRQKPITQTNKEPDEDLVKDVQLLKEERRKRVFGEEHGLSNEEVDSVFKFANGRPTKDTLNHPFVKAGIESLRAARRLESNIPSSTSRSISYQGKPFSELSEPDREKAFKEKIESLKK